MREPGDEVAERADPGPDLWLGGRLRLYQPPRGAHRAGTDAVLLSRLVRPKADVTIVDIGAASGAVGLAVALMEPSARIVLVERDADLVRLARRNIEENGRQGLAVAIAADVFSVEARRAAGLGAEMADIVLTNPPFFEAGRHRPSPIAGKASAHTFAEGGLELWLKACLDVLKPAGTLGLIHRADALPACLAAMSRRFGGITARPVYARVGQPAIRVLIKGIKGSRAPFSVVPPLILYGEDGVMTPEAEAFHRGQPWPV